jgi:Asp-tRNA(Asn)/Glu-tRNA(Gln) amidotransferase A subunit family amidase
LEAVNGFTNLTPEAWATVTVGIITVAAQIVALVVAYALGKAQGRAQTRHEKAAEVIVTGLRLTKRVGAECGVWAHYRKRDESELKYRAEILRLRGELQDLVYDNSPWLEPQTQSKLRPVIRDLGDFQRDHAEAIKSGDEARAQRSGERLSEWTTKKLIQMQNDLEDEARRIIGTKRHWSRTRWGKPLAWITRTTRFFVAYRWVQRKLGQRMGTVSMVLAVALLGPAIYWFATGAPITALVLFALTIGILLGRYLSRTTGHP